MKNKYNKDDILKIIDEEGIEFIYLQFTDIFGIMKNVAIPAEEILKALNNEVTFDGSCVDGFVRIEESDMYLRPDIDTFCVYPWGEPLEKRQDLYVMYIIQMEHPLKGIQDIY